MSKHQGLMFGFTMQQRHYDAMLMEHPGLFIQGDLMFFNTCGTMVAVTYYGWPNKIAAMANMVWDWKTKPPTDDQLRDILGEESNGQG